MSKKYIAEFVGTFTLAFTVLAAVVASGPLPVPIPVIAGLVLGLFVYTIGSISGCHINPAVTIGLLPNLMPYQTLFHIQWPQFQRRTH